MELDPNADRGFISQVRDMIIGYQQQAGVVQPQATGPDAGPGAIPGTLELPPPDMGGMPGMPLPIPTMEGEQSRGPRPGVDTQGAVDELARIMAGS